MINFFINKSSLRDNRNIGKIKGAITIIGLIVALSVRIWWYVKGWNMYMSPENDC